MQSEAGILACGKLFTISSTSGTDLFITALGFCQTDPEVTAGKHGMTKWARQDSLTVNVLGGIPIWSPLT